MDDTDRAALLNALAQGMQRFDAQVLAYCLIGNHYHFVLHTRQANLSRLMRHVNGVYIQAFNRRHGKMGHLPVPGPLQGHPGGPGGLPAEPPRKATRDTPRAQRMPARPLAHWLGLCSSREEALYRAHTEGALTLTAPAGELGQGSAA